MMKLLDDMSENSKNQNGKGNQPVARILVVDDDEGNLVAMEGILADLGHPVVCVRSGEDALRQVLRNEFAVILLDVRMPGIDGYETAELIRGRMRSRSIPIIFLSGVDKDPSNLFRGYATGAVDFVFKPVEPMALRSKVTVFANLYNQAQEIRRQAEHEKRLMAENLRVKLRQMEVVEALDRAQIQQSLVIDTLPIALYSASPQDRYQTRRFVGGNIGRLLGESEDILTDVGANWLQHVHESDRDRLATAIDNATETGRLEIEYRFNGPGDNQRWLFERAGFRKSENGGPPEMYGILSDISSQKSLEGQLVHAQKMEAVGQMSGGIAHDFNNMLSVIIGSLDRVLDASDLSEKTRRRLDLAMQAANSCADLTKQLLGFARRQSLDPRHLQLNEEINRFQGLFDRLLGSSVTTEISCPEDLWPVYLDPSQFEAAIVNLAVNARDAMPEGGRLTIGGENLSLDSEAAKAANLKPGDYVRLSVADTGTGMDQATQKKALEPFFTTKDPGKGTGLGLSSIYGFMRQSGGGLEIDSEPGKGTAMHLYLPRSNDPASARRTEEGGPTSERFDGLKVLVVEDNDDVREVAVSMLEALGCEASTAASGDIAAACLDDYHDISVLFTDCVMPGKLDGVKLAETMTSRDPNLVVIFTSGYRGKEVPLPKRKSVFLRKPYTTAQLASALVTVSRNTP
uniref:response regulator n=1 Tax=Pararhizobium sp. IMCC3301 TaxID=3067904 RepID=UPI002740EB38|nr:response regulator [Pararhizobium sp. IMCC3301]